MNNALIIIALIAQVTLLILFKSESVTYDDVLRANIEAQIMEMEAADKALIESTLNGDFLEYDWDDDVEVYDHGYYDYYPGYSDSY